MRPSSATVAGQAGRFLSNQQSKRKVQGLAQANVGRGGLDNISYSYQHPTTQSGKNISIQGGAQGLFGTQRKSNLLNAGVQRPPMPRSKNRPQSAARNQM